MRFEVYHSDKALAFGTDHACGEFLQIWSTDDHTEPDFDNILVDEDTMGGLNKARMLELIAKHGFAMKELEAARFAS